MANGDKPTTNADGGERDDQDRAVTALSRRALNRKVGALPPLSAIDDELLLRYFDGSLSADERSGLELQLRADPDAVERLAILSVGLKDAGIARPKPAVSSIAQAAQAVQRAVFYVGSGLLELLRGEQAKVLVPAAVRGATDPARPTAFQIDRLFHTPGGTLAARFELHAERPEGAEGGKSALVDLVVHVDAAGNNAQPLEGIRCKLLRDGRAIDSREVEAVGCTFTRLGPARYDVELRKGGVEIGRVLFDLRG